MFILTAICREKKCDNKGIAFTKKVLKQTYESSDGTTRIRTDLACPICRTWARIIKNEEVQ
jgi:hypothetical protein